MAFSTNHISRSRAPANHRATSKYQFKISFKKRGPPIDQDDRGQKVTAAGGSAINTAVFVQNCAQVKIYI